MKRFILPSAPDPSGLVRLSGKDYHYLVRVRRYAPGETFPGLLPEGGRVLVRVRSVDRKLLTGECLPEAPEEGEIPRPALPPVILFQALPRADKMDLIVRQAAEGGISEIVPFVSEHSVPRRKDGETEKLRRWERILKEARQQSGSGTATALRGVLGFEQLLEYWRGLREAGALGLLFHQIPLEQGSLHGYLCTKPASVVLTIGPEGGFSPAEAARFKEEGFKILTIGDTVLRTETAALYGAAAVRVILLESASWTPVIPPPGSG